MLKISQFKVKIPHTKEEIEKKLCKSLQIQAADLKEWSIEKQSLDARKKPELFYVYTICVKLSGEQQILKKLGKKKLNFDINPYTPKEYRFPDAGEEELPCRPVIIGFGPAGMFAAYMLAKQGYSPIVLERGASVEERCQDVENFWKIGKLSTQSNVQFGEGGAGTFSDGKLNTLIKDPGYRIHEVLKIFALHGAPEDILYTAKPHIGTDLLQIVVRNMRNQIASWGGEVHFHHVVKELQIADGKVSGVLVDTPEGEALIPTEIVILAPGHSARDTFLMLKDKEIPMEAKAFAVGVRVEHPQEMIDHSQYGMSNREILPAAAYKLTHKLKSGRGIFSFCMCPGGNVVNASSEEGMLAVNGMSYRARDGKNANSAIIITVEPEDFAGSDPLRGMYYQRELERKAYLAGHGKIPVQRLEDLKLHKKSAGHGEFVSPDHKGEDAYSDLYEVFSERFIAELLEGMEAFGRKIKGFDHPDTLLSAVESRTSAPVRIVRDEKMESQVKGLFPCGEGAGYAGGITSAAVDGIKIAEELRNRYKSLKN